MCSWHSAQRFLSMHAQPLVVLEMAADKGELRTELARLPSRHAAAHPEGLGFVRSGKHNPTPDGDGLAAQRRVEQLLDRSIEGIQVCMEDGGCPTVHLWRFEGFLIVRT